MLPLIAPALVLTVVAAVFYGRVRFRAPAEPGLVALAAVAVDHLLRRRSPPEAAPAARHRASVGRQPSPSDR
ncbi:hypothetical protein [Iamia sp.]|uniref:hypothetical protein n=1 Tax=Iamia sp. TaxID=2722710 RepID=UPI002B780143|nr:hypothetical protein [Iamia sp.]HXH59229.1 hypothetical protein [Iamia sp.]